MATWFEITYTGEPTEDDYARVAELAAQGFTSGQLINEPEDEDTAQLPPWLPGQDRAGTTLTAEVLFAGEARLDAIGYTGQDVQAAVSAVRDALTAGTIEEARVTDVAGAVIYDSGA